MKLNFFKYQGTGNDFVMIDNRTEGFDAKNLALITRLCERRFGIGADGLILLENHDVFDFQMVYFNSDGSQSMCGNGGRCAVQFAHDVGLIKKETTFLAIDGEHDAFIKDGLVHLKMIDVSVIEDNGDHYYMSTGSPQYVRFVHDLEHYYVEVEGRKVRYNQRFKEQGTNVNFVEKKGETLYVRTYERGVEDETYSCGTGVTASAIAASLKENMHSPVPINTLGGNLSVSFKTNENSFTDIFLIGPAVKVFAGVVEIN